MSITPLLLLAVVVALYAAEPVYSQKLSVTAEPVPEFDRLFARTSGWTGADGDYSVALSENSVLWLYSDTWVGSVVDNRHVDSVIVNNSVGRQSGRDPSKATVEFFYGRDEKGKPAALIRPADGRGWFWIYDGIVTKRGLNLFLMQVDRTEGGGGFRHTGSWLGIVADPHESPDRWQVRQSRIPFGRFSAEGDILFGSALLKEGKYIYIYGTSEIVEDGWFHRKRMILARAPADKLDDFSRWRFFADGRWVTDFRRASPLADNLANEYSVSFQKAAGKFVAVYTENGISPNIVVRTAPSPSGKWSDPIPVFRCPEADWGEKIICYAAKAHPELSRAGDELIISYIASSSDFWQMAADARLYRPRFVRLRFR